MENYVKTQSNVQRFYSVVDHAKSTKITKMWKIPLVFVKKGTITYMVDVTLHQVRTIDFLNLLFFKIKLIIK